MTTSRLRRPASPATLRLAEAGYSQQALADRAEVTVGAVSRWLRGERNGPACRKLRLVVEAQLPAEVAESIFAAIPEAEERRAA
jgi:transcriptional regulator with XRE-family HTH domain